MDRTDIHIGDLFDVSNKVWGIPPEKRLKHPGAVLSQGKGYHKAVVAKGQDIKKVLQHLRWLYYEVKPDKDNRLDKDTAFYCVAEEKPLAALQQSNFRGRLSDEDLQNLMDCCCF